MAAGQSVNLKTSFIDVLLGALGAVAMLVVLFSALQNLNAARSIPVPGRLLILEIEGTHDALSFGDTLGIAIEDPDGNRCVLAAEQRCQQPAGSTSTGSTLVVDWPRSAHRANRPFMSIVGTKASGNLRIIVWLRHLAPEVDLAPFRGSRSVTVRARWHSEEDQVRKLSLRARDGFFGSLTLPLPEPD